MQKLIDAYKTNPNAKTINRVLAHADKHPFSTLLLSSADTHLLGQLTLLRRVFA
jgi:hypothetical protein